MTAESSIIKDVKENAKPKAQKHVEVFFVDGTSIVHPHIQWVQSEGKFIEIRGVDTETWYNSSIVKSVVVTKEPVSDL